jgi:hypothetical protein
MVEKRVRAVPRRRLAPLVALVAVVAAAGLIFAAAAGAATVKQIWDGSATATWTAQIGGSGTSNDAANAVIATSGGVTYVTGHVGTAAGTTDLTLTEFVNGAKKWTKTYNGAGHGNDGGAAIAFGPRGTLYTAGWTTNTAGNEDMLLIKWTTTGKRLWVRTYNGPKHHIDFVSALTVDRYGNATVTGPSDGKISPAYSNIAVVDWSSKGVRRWVQRYAGTGHGADLPQDVLAAKDGSVYMTGWAWMSGAKYAAITARFSLAGKLVWSRTYLGADALGAVGNALAACPTGGVYVGGGVVKTATGTDGMVLRYTVAGALKVFATDTNGATGTTGQWFNDIAVTTGRHVIAAGETQQNDAAPNGDAYFEDYTSAGHATWPAGSNIMAFGPGVQFFAKVATDGFGGYYLAGTESSPSNIFVYRGSQNFGGGFWQCIWGNDASHIGDNAPNAIAVAGTTCWVVGSCATPASGTDQIILGFAY